MKLLIAIRRFDKVRFLNSIFDEKPVFSYKRNAVRLGLEAGTVEGHLRRRGYAVRFVEDDGKPVRGVV